MISLTSMDKICTDYSWWTLDGLWMVKAPAIVTIQIRLCMDEYPYPGMI